MNYSLSTTPLHSGFAPLAPVGPPNLSSSISGLSQAHETQAEVLGLRKALEYETLCEGIVGLPEMRETDVHL